MSTPISTVAARLQRLGAAGRERDPAALGSGGASSRRALPSRDTLRYEPPHETCTPYSWLCQWLMVCQLAIACTSIFQLTRDLWADVARRVWEELNSCV